MDSKKVPLSGLKKTVMEEIFLRIDCDESNRKFLRIEFRTELFDPLLWLKVQRNKEKVYFEPRGKGEPAVVGVGSACHLIPGTEEDLISYFEKLNKNIPKGSKFYGGVAFFKDQKGESEWKSFDKFNFILPRFEYMIRDKKGYFTINLSKKELKGANLEKVIREVEEINLDIPEKFEKTWKTEFISFSPERGDWVDTISSYLKKIEKGEVKKIVAARRVELKKKGKADPFKIVSDLKKAGDYAANFLITFNSKDFFVGSTPERLFHRDGELLTTESLAGTISRGNYPAEDEKFGDQLLTSKKETLEHDFVTDDIVKKIDPVCELVAISERVLLKLSNLQHLYRRISGKLKKGISDGEILDKIFPTPAVCGLPLKQCLSILSAGESFQRGWYAGAVGFAGKEVSDYYVGIRSVLVSGEKIYVYSGAGIVKGSDPFKEWEEVDLKTKKYKKILKYET